MAMIRHGDVPTSPSRRTAAAAAEPSASTASASARPRGPRRQKRWISLAGELHGHGAQPLRPPGRPAQPAAHGVRRKLYRPGDRPVPLPGRRRVQHDPDRLHRVRPPRQPARRHQHVAAAAADTAPPSRPLPVQPPVEAAHRPDPGMPPRPQPPAAATPQTTGAQPALRRGVVQQQDHTGSLPTRGSASTARRVRGRGDSCWQPAQLGRRTQPTSGDRIWPGNAAGDQRRRPRHPARRQVRPHTGWRHDPCISSMGASSNSEHPPAHPPRWSREDFDRCWDGVLPPAA